MVVVYSHTTSPRLLYILDFLSHYYGQSFGSICDKELFEKSNGFRINYSDKSLASDLQIVPVDLLFEATIHPIPIACFKHREGFSAFFKTDESELSFDLFAAVFYLLSRYEEYLPHEKDSYGRYAHTNSIAFKNGFLHKPLVNTWLEYFRTLIASKISNFKFQTPNFSFIPTYDIDMAWSYWQKGIVRNTGGTLRSMANGEWPAVKERLEVITGNAKDPFDCFDWLANLHRQHSLQPLYFFLVGKVRNAYDKNIPLTNPAFQHLLTKTSETATIGVHPSWHSGDFPSAIGEEKEAIQSVLEKLVTASRQHYIRFTLPQTFRHLLAAGITDDYSMGYGSINGFRASVASSFYWYDLEREEQTALLLHPFCFMDANSFYEQKQTAGEALEELLYYHQQVAAVNGILITVWHNSIFGTSAEFKGWRELYEQFIEQLTSSR